jgi:hypothetical protein
VAAFPQAEVRLKTRLINPVPRDPAARCDPNLGLALRQLRTQKNRKERQVFLKDSGSSIGITYAIRHLPFAILRPVVRGPWSRLFCPFPSG